MLADANTNACSAAVVEAGDVAQAAAPPCRVGFRQTVASRRQEVGVVVWRDAPTMVAECAACLARACLISLEHDLEVLRGEADPGTVLDVAKFLSLHPPSCPVSPACR